MLQKELFELIDTQRKEFQLSKSILLGENPDGDVCLSLAAA